jgi:hypothetical protein
MAYYKSQKGLKKNFCNVKERGERRGKYDDRTDKLKGCEIKQRKAEKKGRYKTDKRKEEIHSFARYL